MTALRQSPRPPWILDLGYGLFAGCGHSPLFVTAAPDSLGPRTLTLPRRLTYSTGDDCYPTVVGSVLASRGLDPGRSQRHHLGRRPHAQVLDPANLWLYELP